MSVAKSAQPKAAARRSTARLVRRAPAKPKAKTASQLTSNDDHPITFKAGTATELPGVILRRDKTGKVTKVATRPLEWSLGDFSSAIEAGRFLVTTPRPIHQWSLAKVSSEPDARYEDLLSNLSTIDLAMLRDSVPLYWIDQRNPNGLRLVSYRGKLPSNCDSRFAEGPRQLFEAELRQRGIDQWLCDALDKVEHICQHGSPEMVKALTLYLEAMSLAIGGAK